jgi:nicotinamide riboside kinase
LEAALTEEASMAAAATIIDTDFISTVCYINIVRDRQTMQPRVAD